MAIVTIVAKLTARKDAIEAVKGELLKMIEPSRQEAGCLEYRLHQDNSDPAVFVFYENWKDMASFERHTTTPHFKSYVAAVGDLLVDKVSHKMTCIA